MNMNANVIYSYVLSTTVLCWSLRFLYKNVTEREIRRCWEWDEELEHIQCVLDYELREREYRESLLVEIKVFEEEHKQNPGDAQILKNLAKALVNLLHLPAEETDYNKIEHLYGDAKSHLEKALEINPDDQEARLQLGHVLYFMLLKLKMERNVFIKLCYTAIGHLEEVQKKAPGLVKRSMLEEIKELLPSDLSKLKAPEVHKDSTLEKMQKNIPTERPETEREAPGLDKCSMLEEIKELLPSDLSKLKAPEVHKDSTLEKMQKNIPTERPETEQESSGLKDMEDDEMDEKICTIYSVIPKCGTAKNKNTKYSDVVAGLCKVIPIDLYVDNQRSGILDRIQTTLRGCKGEEH